MLFIPNSEIHIPQFIDHFCQNALPKVTICLPICHFEGLKGRKSEKMSVPSVIGKGIDTSCLVLKKHRYKNGADF
jgi:hypothetical protein